MKVHPPMFRKPAFTRSTAAFALFAAFPFATSALYAQKTIEATGSLRARPLGRVSPAIAVSNDLGRVDNRQTIGLTVHLRTQNDALHAAVDSLYDPASPSFHKWMTDTDLQKFAPSPAKVQEVTRELESHGLTVEPTDANGFSLSVKGSVASVEEAFHTELHQFAHGKNNFRANTTPAHLSDAVDSYVSSVAGLESHTVKPLIRRALDSKSHEAIKSIPLKKVVQSATGLGAYQTDIAMTNPMAYTFTTPGATLPVGIYYGQQYDSNQNLVVDFTASQLQGAYGLTAAYQQGLTGKGQTIVLLEAYGDSYMETDANAFSEIMGLPALTSSNFSVVYPEGKQKNQDFLASSTGWDGEISLDIDWAHAMAPEAKIVVVVSAGQDDNDFQYCMSYIVAHKLGYAVSDSWELDSDLFAGPAEQQAFEDILELAAAKGVSFQFSTGDGGDGGLGTPIGAPGVPSVAPHATAVGGTALLNRLGDSGFLSVGWGDTISFLDDYGVIDPPNFVEFLGGGGGGESTYWAKPSWQKALPGKGRQTPDVSALGDPYTGVPIVLTQNGIQEIFFGNGGTSLSSPIFTAFWAIAQQKAGAPLGQAAPLLSALPRNSLTDVLPTTSNFDVTGEIVDNNGATYYNAAAPFQGALYDNTGFTSGMWNLSAPGSPFYVDIAFGLDSSLTVTPGWDNVTGYGTPSGVYFLDEVALYAAKKK